MASAPAINHGLDGLIGAIYDCVIDPSRWHDTIDHIRQRYGFFNAFLGVNNTFTQEMVLSIAVNLPPEMAAIAHQYSGSVGDLWGGWARVNAIPLEEPVSNLDLITPEARDRNPYYQHFAKPQGISNAVGIALARDSTTIANLTMGRHLSASPLEERDFDELRVLAPHLRRAIVIGRLLETSVDAARTFSQVLDASRAGVVLVDSGRRVIHANSVARAMLAACDPIHEATGRLEFPNEVVPGALETAIASASLASAGAKGAGIPGRRADGTPLTVQVLPLERRVGSNLSSQAVAAVFVAESVTGPVTSAKILSQLYDLTPAETRIFLLIVDGQELVAISTQLGISTSTAKTHLARIYAKTGQNSRVGLARLAQEVAPPVGD